MGRFVRNPNFQREFERSPDWRAEALKRARAVGNYAEDVTRRIMPRGPQAFKVEPTPRGARVSNLDHGGHLAEFGSVNNPPYAPLRKGVTASGLRLEAGEAE